MNKYFKSNNNITTLTSDTKNGSINDVDENISNTHRKPRNIDNKGVKGIKTWF